MAISTMTSKGQLTVPKSIREYLGIDSGNKIEFIIDEVGRVVMIPKTLDIEDIFGMIDRRIGASIDDMNKVFD